MKEYKIVYCKAFGYDYEDETTFIPSEISTDKAVDIHHIVTREDRIENLMALTRIEHTQYGEIQYLMVLLLKIHKRRLEIAKIPFDNKWFEKHIKRYENET